MKTSKIIFITFWSMVALFLLSFLIPASTVGRRGADRAVKAYLVPKFSHIVMAKGANLTMENSFVDTLWIRYDSRMGEVQPNFSVKGDTLFVMGQSPTEGYCNIIVSGNQVESVSVNNANLDVATVTRPYLFLQGDGGRIDFYDSANIDSLTLDLRNGSRMTVQQSNLRFLQISLEKSHAYVYNNKIDELNASLRDTSVCEVGKVLRSHMEADESSRFSSR